MSNQDLDWFLERLDGIKSTSSGYTAHCPAHDDRRNSLSIAQGSDGTVVFHCFAGCDFSSIMTAFESLDEKPQVTVRRTIPETVPADTAMWWEEYTGVPIRQWLEWGVIVGEKTIEFTWIDTPVVKIRRAGTKDISWKGSPTPPLWPDVPEKPPAKIYITEGETDCGVLRFLGFPAWAVTKGALTSPPGVWESLKARGVEEIILAFDDDESGKTGAKQLASRITAAGLRSFTMDIGSAANPLLGEKDIRDVWKRVKNDEKMIEIVHRLSSRTLSDTSKPVRISVDELLSRPIDPENWLIDKVWLRGNVGMLVGAPKMKKSFLSLDMAISVATGTPFLGTFAVPRSGPVVVVGKEDTDASLQDRLEKMMVAKKFGGQNKMPRIQLPMKTGKIPLFLDMSRDFVFDDVHTESLLQWMYEIEREWGQISMVVIDPVLKSLPVGVDEYRASEIASTVFGSATRLQQATGSSVVLVHHRAKGSGDGKNFLGSVMFFAASESSLFLQGDGEDEDGFIGVQGVYKSAPDQFWRYRYDDLDKEYRVTVDQQAKVKVASKSPKTKDGIVNLLATQPSGLVIPQLIEALNSTDAAVRRSLKELEDAGLVHRLKSDVKSSGGGPRPDLWVLS